MARFLQGLIPQIKKAALYLGLNVEVATKNWPTRGTYRVAPASAPAPSFTHNFPLKQDKIADLDFQNRGVRISREAMEFPVVLSTVDPRKDSRNVWNTLRLRIPSNLNSSVGQAAHDLPRFGQVSERHELTL